MTGAESHFILAQGMLRQGTDEVEEKEKQEKEEGTVNKWNLDGNGL